MSGPRSVTTPPPVPPGEVRDGIWTGRLLPGWTALDDEGRPLGVGDVATMSVADAQTMLTIIQNRRQWWREQHG